MKGIPEPEEITVSHLIVTANQAFNCYIHPNMREINIYYDGDNTTIHIYVYFDTPPGDSQIDDIGSAITEMSCQFTNDIKWQDHIHFLPYPERIPSKGICIYRRYEPSPD